MPSSGPDAPLNEAEYRRLTSLLDTVSTHSLLQSLLDLDHRGPDARLIITALLDRFPAEEAAITRP